MHPTLHPAAPGSGPNAGVSVGALVQKQGDTTSASIGYGEGFARLGPTGAFEIRTTPQAAFLAYEVPLVTGATSLSVRPSLGASVVRFNEEDPDTGMDDVAAVGVLHPGATLVIDTGAFYAAPRVGLSRSVVIEGDGEGDTAYSFGGTVGFRFPDRMTAEVTVAYSRDTDDPPNTAWTVVPTLGVAIGK